MCTENEWKLKMISHSDNRKSEPVDTEIKHCHHLNFLLLIRTVGIGIYFVLKLQIVLLVWNVKIFIHWKAAFNFQI